MLIGKPGEIRSFEITPEHQFRNRREIVKTMGLGAAMALLPNAAKANPSSQSEFTVPPVDEELTPEEIVTSFNNFYEFGTDKGDPERNAGSSQPRPWQVKVSGECEKPARFDLEDLLKRRTSSRNASTGSAAWKPGRWWCPGSGSRWDVLASSSPPPRRSTSRSARCSGLPRCRAEPSLASSGPTSKGCASTRP